MEVPVTNSGGIMVLTHDRYEEAQEPGGMFEALGVSRHVVLHDSQSGEVKTEKAASRGRKADSEPQA